VQTRIIATYAPEAIKQHILPGVCSGEHILAICMTGPDAGTTSPIIGPTLTSRATG
jgi:alkylation response protein AidB-like acyl-CoA dehydrogenase